MVDPATPDFDIPESRGGVQPMSPTDTLSSPASFPTMEVAEQQPSLKNASPGENVNGRGGPEPIPSASQLLAPSCITGRVYDALCDFRAVSHVEGGASYGGPAAKLMSQLLGCIAFFDDPWSPHQDHEIAIPAPV